MRQPTLILALLLGLNALVDWYIYRAVKQRTKSKALAKTQLWSAVLLAFVLLAGIFIPFRTGSSDTLHVKQFILFGYFSIYIVKYIFTIFDLIGSIPQFFHRKRWKWLGRTGMALGICVFGAMWWGTLINRFHIQVNDVDIPMHNLPQAFDGFRIVQISDLHVGTFGTDTTFVSRLVDGVNALQPDLIVFSGDIVNRQSAEMEPFVAPLSRLSAPRGVTAVLGNHDYGDYYDWGSPQAKRDNMELLYRLYKDCGIRLLRNETIYLRQGNDSIALIGVENIGDPPFPIYGSLSKAYLDLSDETAKVLVSHNPAHWVDSIKDAANTNVGLTLAGHTHAMQIEVAGISPAALRYPTWGGLYADADSTHLLYVNIGAGEVGMPMRLGATPEITVLTLRKR